MADPNQIVGASENRTDADKGSTAPSHHRAPAPKGSSEGKPPGQATNAAPAPKGEKGAKPTIENGAAPAPKQPRTPNPTYANATQFVSQYFRREAELSDLFWKAASAGFEAFKVR